jgi:maleate isomerase
MRVESQVVDRLARFDERPSRWRIGFLALSTDFTAEWDFARLNPSQDLAIYVNRVPFANPTTRENLLAMQPRLMAAAEMILPDAELDACGYGCTSASAVIGDEAVRNSVQAAKPGVPVVTPTSGAMAAFEALGAKKISLLTPYIAPVSDDLAAYFQSLGLEILNAACFGVADDRQIAHIQPAAIVEAAHQVCDPKADALFLSCTALRAVDVIAELEQRLGIPVVTSNQALFWKMMRAAGCDLPVAGYGRLLTEH